MQIVFLESMGILLTNDCFKLRNYCRTTSNAVHARFLALVAGLLFPVSRLKAAK